MPQRRTAERPDLISLRREVDAWYGVKHQSNLITNQLNKGKKALQAILEKFGEPDPSTGSLFLDLGEPVGDHKISKLKNQKATSTSCNVEKAEEILRSKGMWDEMVELVPVLDEGLVRAAYYDNRITDDELAQMFPQRVSYTFVLLDDADKPVY